MKYIFIVMIIAMVLLLASCSSTEYKYSGRWNPEKEFSLRFINVDEEVSRKYGTVTHDYDQTLYRVKEEISDALGQYDFLHWEEFSQVKTVKMISLSEEDKENLTEDERTMIESSTCFYVSGEINILPNFLKFSVDFQKAILTHELLHSLISNIGSREVDNIDEGIVDFFTCKVTQDVSAITYPNEYAVVYWLTNAYGEEAVLKAASQDELYILIDNSTEKGMADKLNLSLAIVCTNDSHVDYQKMLNIQLDILCHLTKNEGKKAPSMGFKMFESLCTTLAGPNASIDKKYFEKLLE